MPYEYGFETSFVDDAREIGSIVRGRRIVLGISQADLAEKAGVGRRFVVDLEAGKATVQADALFKVCVAVDVELLAKRPRAKNRMFAPDEYAPSSLNRIDRGHPSPDRR